MAVIKGVVSDIGLNDGSAKQVFWEAVGDGDSGAPVELIEWGDRTVQVKGTFDGATLTMQGSNDGAVWVTLTDPLGNNVAFTAAGGKAILERYRYVRPLPSSTSGNTDLDITMTMVRTSGMRN